jgi:hypothetical protein
MKAGIDEAAALKPMIGPDNLSRPKCGKSI